mmetsp:Transcript_42937/g.84668  ORF Transcript_42937/g.84668 Transcript_42937/m.84668 type:complete len:295 (+) Transcript_42937:357-1241(+)
MAQAESSALSAHSSFRFMAHLRAALRAKWPRYRRCRSPAAAFSMFSKRTFPYRLPAASDLSCPSRTSVRCCPVTAVPMSCATFASCAAILSKRIRFWCSFNPFTSGSSASFSSSLSLMPSPPPVADPPISAFTHIFFCFFIKCMARKYMSVSVNNPKRMFCSVVFKSSSRWSPGWIALRSETCHLGSSSRASSGIPLPSASMSSSSTSSPRSCGLSLRSLTTPSALLDGTYPNASYLDSTSPKYHPSRIPSSTSFTSSAASVDATSRLCSTSNAFRADPTQSKVLNPLSAETST